MPKKISDYSEKAIIQYLIEKLLKMREEYGNSMFTTGDLSFILDVGKEYLTEFQMEEIRSSASGNAKPIVAMW